MSAPAKKPPANAAEGTEAKPRPPAESAPAPQAEGLRFGEKAPGERHPLLRPRVLAPILVVLFLLNIPFYAYWLRGPAPVSTTIPFQDDFARPDGSPGPNYFSTGGFWRIIGGALYSPAVKNNPLWLEARLPRNVQVDFDVRAASPEGDLKCEIFGNGRDHESGYILIFGGWHNSISVLARLDEHGHDRKERRDTRVEEGRTYHFRITRQGKLLSWYIDGKLFLSWNDRHPLYGAGHDRFGFDTWDSAAYFDNLVIKPL